MKKETTSISQAQEVKRTIFGQRENRVIFEVTLASLAFGISREKLDQLGEKYEELVISPQRDGLVEISIRPEIENWKKEMLGEVVDCFSSQKKEGTIVKKAYMRAYQALQRHSYESGFDQESDLRFCQSSLGDLWEELTDFQKKNLDNQGLSPGDVLRSMGIIGSDV